MSARPVVNAFAVALLGLAPAAAPAGAEELPAWAASPASADDLRELAAWLDEAGVPSPRGKLLVRVYEDDGPLAELRPGPTALGWIVDEDAAGFRVLHGLVVRTYRGAAAVAFGDAPVYSVLAGDLPASVRRGPEAIWPSELRRCVAPSEALTAALVARAAWEKGLVDEGRALLSEALAAAGGRAALRAHLETEVPRVLLAELLAAAPWLAWDEVRRGLSAFLERFPASAGAPAARDLLAALPAPTGAAPDAAALGLALRDLDGPDPRALVAALADGPPGDPFDPSGPFRRLARLGLQAAPALVAALDDRTVTRFRGPSLSDPGEALARRGEVARRLLGRIAGTHFPTRADARAWWARAESLGPTGYLLRRIEVGPADEAGQAVRALLIASDRSGAALAPIVPALERRRDGGRLRDGVLFLCGELTERDPCFGRDASAAPLARLGRAALRSDGASLDVVVAAARLLVRSGAERADWVDAVVRALGGVDSDDAYAGLPAVELLSVHGGAPGLGALRRRYAELPAPTRQLALELGRVPAGPVFTGDRAELAAALLVDALGDDAGALPFPVRILLHGAGVQPLGSGEGPRQLRDLAAFLLAPRLGLRPGDALSRDRHVRAALREALRARWAALHGRAAPAAER